MFGKLLKYEFRSIGKWYFALNAFVIAIAAILSFTIKLFAQSNSDGLFGVLTNKMLPLTLGLTFGSLIAGSLLSTLLIIIKRFSKSVFGREGYLTLTLPVNSHQIILSKLLASFICSVFNTIILAFAIAIVIVPMFNINELLEGFFNSFKMDYFINMLTVLAYVLLSTFTSILLIYLSISIGQLFSNRRGLMAFIAYFILVILISVAATYVHSHIFNINTSADSFPFTEQKTIYLLILEQFMEMIMFYLATNFIIKNKLNLQ
ncbi:TPA: ABC transporter permease [Streptococcus pyogenes]|nr:ABC transporter permease [Streptococcus pyogenes]